MQVIKTRKEKTRIHNLPYRLSTGVDPGIFERGGPEAIIYKILERGGPKSLKMAFECSFQSLSYKSFANIPQKGGAQAPWAPPLNPPLEQTRLIRCLLYGFVDYCSFEKEIRS